MEPNELFEKIEKGILFIKKQKEKPVRVAINGIEGTGKTVFAQNLTTFLVSRGLTAIQVSIDGFHFNKEVRYQQGRDSAKGYYEDSYNELAFVEKVLMASQGEKPNYTMAIHDLETDEVLNLESIEIPNDAILITDGAYLFKPNYRNHWDLKIYLKTDFKTALERGVNRDMERLGGYEATKDKFKNRYHRASMLYILEVKPEEFADIIVNNTDFKNLKLIENTVQTK
ncbi:hypothetical protein [Xanthovirga aplysinae]|uniref:hypothetical protein n=1 Tax=Xanthovirga aplysinae TaxID=2529853 RepID=UPI0012BC5205|nr:hypothetical protein [Xanthovirga aplysinae]MTI32108.1 hypothetical protein [Xanthovirga aplysinae]